MARRGDSLREHILYIAKDVFLEMGFERASMDAIAARAETSKRTLYAHFENKEKLYLAVIDLVRGLFTGNLKKPADYSDKPAEALVIFCGRYLEILLYERSIKMSRASIAETARFPEGSAQYFDVIFTGVHDQLSAYLKETFGLTSKPANEAAQRLLGQVLYPRFPRALFGMDDLIEDVPANGRLSHVDLKPIRKAVADLLALLNDNEPSHASTPRRNRLRLTE